MATEVNPADARLWEQQARQILYEYDRAARASGARQVDALRAQAARAIVANAEAIAAYDEPTLRAACRQVVETHVRQKFAEGLASSQAVLSPDERQSLFELTRGRFEMENAEATDRLYAVAQQRRAQIWHIALQELKRIGPVRIAFETAPDVALITMH